MARRWPEVILALLIAAYVAFFSAVSIQMLRAQIPEKADLGQIDLAIWNTSRGRFVQEVKGEEISTRLTDHVEPIFWPVSLLFWLWDDVRALLVLQAAVTALGAIPIYLLAREVMGRAMRDGQGRGGNAAAAWWTLAFPLTYLAFPALQAAHLADFHAIPLATAPIAFAFWFAERRDWGKFLPAVGVLLTVKEEAALLACLLGVWAAWRRRAWRVGLLVVGVSLIWFYLATFVIIPHYAQPVYGAGESVYFQRYQELGGGPGEILRTLLTRPAAAWAILTEPARLAYVGGLLASAGFLSLLAPEVLALCLPLLAANALSNYWLQYSGELHYSAPLAPYFVIAALFGTARLLRWARGKAAPVALGWLLLWVVGYQVAEGFTPIGREFTWPQVTPHHRLLARFKAQIPPRAPGSVTTGLYPHLSHRERLYMFPAVGDAEWVLLDVTGPTAMHPVDLKRRYEELVNVMGFRVQDAADGYILLRKGEGSTALPDAFYDFARVPQARPQHPADILFGDSLRFLGYDLVDDGKWGVTSVKTYWRAEGPLPASLRPWSFFVGPNGKVVDDMTERPAPALLWYPPDRWRVGEVVVVQTLPWYLPPRWAVAVGALNGPTWDDPSARWPARCQRCDGIVLLANDTWARLGIYRRVGRALATAPPDAQDAPSHPLQAEFAEGITLLGYDLAPSSARAGQELEVVLHWQARTPPSRDYNVFLHLRDAADRSVAQADGLPSWYGPQPTSSWPPGKVVLDAHLLSLPADLAPGRYRLVAGLYDWRTLERLPLASGGDEVELATLTMLQYNVKLYNKPR